MSAENKNLAILNLGKDFLFIFLVLWHMIKMTIKPNHDLGGFAKTSPQSSLTTKQMQDLSHTCNLRASSGFMMIIMT